MRDIYILIAVAFLAISFMVGILLFTPSMGNNKKKINKEINERVVEEGNDTIEDKKDVFCSETSEEPRFMFESSERPRNDATSHRMDERYFKSFKLNEYEYMTKNLQERLTSLHNANVKANKAKRVYKYEK